MDLVGLEDSTHPTRTTRTPGGGMGGRLENENMRRVSLWL
jgi:hypothetical protein